MNGPTQETTMNDVAKQQTGQGMVVQTPMDLMQAAIDKGVDPDALEKLMDLNDRYLSNLARQEFEAAIAAFQAECPVVRKNRNADRYSYADMDQIMAVVRPILDRHKLSVRFSTRSADGTLVALCKVSHVAGHSEDSEFSCPVDQNMRVNDAQKQASANTYARRYALMNALNIVVTDEDDDGQSAGTVTVTDTQAADLVALIEEVSADEKAFLQWASKAAKHKVDSVYDMPERLFDSAVKLLKRKRK